MKMLTFCSLVLLFPDRLCVEVNFFPVVAGSGNIVLIILFNGDYEHILHQFKS